MKIAVIGAGSWGTAIAGMLGETHEVCLWVRNQELLKNLQMNYTNDCYLPGVKLPESVKFTHDLGESIESAAIILLVTPSHTVREMAANLSQYIKCSKTILVSAAKGLEFGSYKRMSEIIKEEIPIIAERVVVMSGPNHAEEVGRRYPTATVVASHNEDVAAYVQAALMTSFFRAYTNSDVIGVELCGALKNIIALGAGIADGLGFGDNTKAALMTRGLAEICRLGTAMNANTHTFAGLAGIGDLIATCTSKHSRNRWAGMLLAQGKTAEDIQTQTHMVVEGFRSTYAGYHLSQIMNVEMPITSAIYRVVYKNSSPRDEVLDLMNRSRTDEIGY